MKSVIKQIIIASVSIFISAHAMDVNNKKHILLPLADHLFKVNTAMACAKMGYTGMASAALTSTWRSSLKSIWSTVSGQPPDQKEMVTKLFAILSQIESEQGALTATDLPKVYWQGIESPHILVRWLQGHETCEKLQGIVIPYIQRNAGRVESASLEASAKIIFDPVANADTMQPHEETLELLRSLRSAGHTLHLFDNWNGQAFAQLKERHPEPFKLINGHMHVSGETHQVKCANNSHFHDNFFAAHPEIKPESCLVIETEEMYTAPLKQKSLQHVVCQNGEIAKLRIALQKMGLLEN